MNRLWQDLKAAPGLLIALIVGAILVLYYIYKQNQGGSSNQNSPIYELDTVSVTPPPPPTGPQPPGPPSHNPHQPPDHESTHFRSQGKGDSPAGAAIYDKPGGKVTRHVKWGSNATITGLATNIKGIDYYPLQGGGYARERDLVGLG